MTEKKNRSRIPQEAKIRAQLQREICSVCPFCENDDVGHFQIHHIDGIPSNNEIENLLLLCPNCHSIITKGDIPQVEVWKRKIQLAHGAERVHEKAKVVQFNSHVGNAVIGDNNRVNVNQQKKKVVNKYPEGTIGSDRDKTNYISYLISRYNEFKEYEVGKGNVRYGVFGAHLKKKYRIGSTKTIYNLPIYKFSALSTYIQGRIDGTMLGKIKQKTQKNYSNFSVYIDKYVNGDD
ncbi:HNH endonuclease signature motif containing protein [Desulfolutivibrio sp.]|uniref:HNH endonuclease signature motif containing protein n=1 Tax=Desulfolutivibrio sp. TaxID=2773296 RepID=UPI002F96C5CC